MYVVQVGVRVCLNVVNLTSAMESSELSVSRCTASAIMQFRRNVYEYSMENSAHHFRMQSEREQTLARFQPWTMTQHTGALDRGQSKASNLSYLPRFRKKI